LVREGENNVVWAFSRTHTRAYTPRHAGARVHTHTHTLSHTHTHTGPYEVYGNVRGEGKHVASIGFGFICVCLRGNFKLYSMRTHDTVTRCGQDYSISLSLSVYICLNMNNIGVFVCFLFYTLICPMCNDAKNA
jgi:hypothetical protein